jgi:hypothetical protein
MNIVEPLILNGADWTASFNALSGQKMIFSCAGRELLSLSGMVFGKIEEASGYCVKCRQHESIDLLNKSAEIVNVIPFGSEPQIVRQFEFAGNRAKITTDFHLKAPMEAESFEVDNILVKGSWAKIGVLKIGKPLPETSDIEWHAVGKDSLWKLVIEDIPLIILFEGNDGTRLEIGTGDDIWRWLQTETFPETTASIVFEKTNGGVSIRRIFAKWTETGTIAPRKYRFTWYFAWETPDRKYFTCGEDEFSVFSFSGKNKILSDGNKCFKFPDGELPELFAARFANDLTGAPCFHSSPVSGLFRDWVRSAAAIKDGRPLVLGNLKASLCDSAPHLERPQKQKLLHWNMIRIFDFCLWANKQLRYSDSSFYILPEGNGKVYSSLPSVKGMSLLTHPGNLKN